MREVIVAIIKLRKPAVEKAQLLINLLLCNHLCSKKKLVFRVQGLQLEFCHFESRCSKSGFLVKSKKPGFELIDFLGPILGASKPVAHPAIVVIVPEETQVV